MKMPVLRTLELVEESGVHLKRFLETLPLSVEDEELLLQVFDLLQDVLQADLWQDNELSWVTDWFSSENFSSFVQSVLKNEGDLLSNSFRGRFMEFVDVAPSINAFIASVNWMSSGVDLSNVDHLPILKAALKHSLTTVNARFHGRTGHIFIGVAASFPSRSTPSGGHPQAGLSATLGVSADSKFTINSYF